MYISLHFQQLNADGTLKGGINKEGINFYNNLINELLENGMESTLFIDFFFLIFD